MTPNTPHRPLASFFAWFVAAVCLPVLALAAPFDIPSQAAPAAFDTFIKQSGCEVFYGYDEVRQVTTNAVKGDYQASEALRLLLENTKLTATAQGAKKFVVSPIPAPKPGSIEGSVRDESGKPVAGAKVAIADSDKAVATDKRGRFVIEAVTAGAYVLQITAEGLQNTRVTDVTVNAGRELSMSPITIPIRKQGTLELKTYTVSAKKNDGVFELDPYFVDGQKPKPFTTANLDLTRTSEDPLPFATFSARDIELTGSANLEDFLRARLSAMVPSFGSERRGDLEAPHINANQFNLRGWGEGNLGGAHESVILVNGRRIPAQNLGTSGDDIPISGNIRGIPLGSIERIEVLTTAGSAIYGAGATGGVINVITKTGWSGGQLTLNYETPLDTHAPKRSADLTYSVSVTPNLNLRINAGYSQTIPLTFGERADITVERVRRALLQNGSIVHLLGGPSRFSAPILSGTPNFKSFSRTPIPLFGAGTAHYSSVPPGYGGGQGFTPFLSRQGVLNLEIGPGYGQGASGRGQDVSFGTETIDKVLGLGAELTLGDHWKLSFEYQHSENTHNGDPFTNSLISFELPASAPTNPFGVPIVGSIADPNLNRSELGSRLRTRNDSSTLTLRGGSSEWRFLFDATWSRDRNASRATQFQDFLPASLSTMVATGEYNPLVDPRVVLPTASANYEEYVQRVRTARSAATNLAFTAKSSGPVARLPAGALQLTAGVEWLHTDRDVSEGGFQEVNSKTLQVLLPDSTLSRRENLMTTDNYAAYAEVSAPLISDGQGVPLAHKLELLASGRIGHHVRDGFRADATAVTYETSPHLWLTGIRYDIIRGLAARISQSDGFRPPTFSQITPALPPTQSTTVIDRRTGQVVDLAASQYVTGGNPDLRPETTRSTNWGVVFEPAFLRGLRLSVDYVDSIRQDAISSVSVQNILDGEPTDPVLATRVQRNATGEITFVDARRFNFREITSKSVDFTLDQRIEGVLGGRLILSAAATRNISFKVQSTADSPPEEQIRSRTGSFRLGFVEWNANAQTRWEGALWTFGWGARYFDSILVTPANYVIQGSDRIPWEIEHDVFLSRRFVSENNRHGWQRILGDSTLSLGVRNVLGREPRFDAGLDAFGYNLYGISSFDSVYGRSVWVQFRRNF